MRKIGLARLGKGNPCPSMSMLWATMVAIVATKHTLRQCGGLECTSNLDGGSVPTPPRAQRVTFDPAQKRSRECIRGAESSVKVEVRNGSLL